MDNLKKRTQLHKKSNTYKLPIHARFELQAQLYPQKIAVICEQEQVTYSQLNERANQVAHRLMELNVGPNMRVGISLHRSINLIVAILGVLKSGGAYISFDPNYPQDRLELMRLDCTPQVLITQSQLLNEIPHEGMSVLCIDDDPYLPSQNIENPNLNISLEDLAYLIYTSGSTGKPKGCLTQHGNVMRLWKESQKLYGFDDSDVWTLFHSYTFDFSVWEIWGPLLHGGTLVIVPYCVSRSPDEFYQLLVREEVTVLNQTPSAFFQLMRVDASQPADALKLRYLILGGEALNFQALKPWVARHGLENPQIINGYGPTETTIFATFKWVGADDLEVTGVSNLGYKIPDLNLLIVDSNLKSVANGEAGELIIGGPGVAKGYLNRPDLTAERFIKNPLTHRGKELFYRTGDLVRYLPDGQMEYLGRIDNQVKLRGFRIELGEIEFVLRTHHAVRDAAVSLREDEPGDAYLAAYFVAEPGTDYSYTELSQYLANSLPEYMVPVTITEITSLPLSPNGKLDRNALPKPEQKRPDLEQPYIAAQTDMERTLASVWCSLLKIDKAGIDDNFFDLGGNSLLSIQMVEKLKNQYGIDLPVVKLFEYPTIWGLSGFLDPKISTSEDSTNFTPLQIPVEDSDARKVAIIGMAGRYPGAENVTELWDNLCSGLESVSFFTDFELDPTISHDVKAQADYVKARGIIKDIEQFDAAFFGINPYEAEVMDPQHRLFLETSWNALEQAGYASESYAAQHAGWIGVYGGVYNNTYYSENVITRPDLIHRAGEFLTMTATEKDYLAMRVSHKLNLKGPSVTVNTACSTSMVAICQAYYALLNQQCDLALAGGASITVPQKTGYKYTEGYMLSKDGHTRPFDEQAKGTVFSDGVGVVVLKRLRDAKRDGDTVYGVLLGVAVNNDGSNKMSFIAPNVEGQASVIVYAQKSAGITPESISYIETHGTATPVGDPIEIEALTQAFRTQTTKNQFCAIGSVKGNLGHTTIAAGVVGVIKTALSLKNRLIPPSINYEKPNPKIDFVNSPFYVNNQLTSWPKGDTPRRAGVSSYGVGGTNAHVILEEAPNQVGSGPSRPKQLIMYSAKTAAALEVMTQQLISYLEEHRNGSLPDIVYTLQTGRQDFMHRRWVLADDVKESIEHLKQLDPQYSTIAITQTRQPEIVFMFPGMGSQYVNMGLSLYQYESVFSEAVDECAQYFLTYLGRDIRQLIYPKVTPTDDESNPLQETAMMQPALFTIEYALARLWMSWGIKPSAMIGHNAGEFVAATLSGVFSLENACRLVVIRGRMMQDLTGFDAAPPEYDLSAPKIPFISAASGTWITKEQAIDPLYWAQHLRVPEQFEEDISVVWEHPSRILLAVGPGSSLNLIAQNLRTEDATQKVLASMPDKQSEEEVWSVLLRTLGLFWQAGVAIDWKQFYANESRHRLALPTYPFERKTFWIESARPSPDTGLTEHQPQLEPHFVEPHFAIETGVSLMDARKNKIISTLKDILEETTGIEMGDYDNEITFFEMGMDSLLLTQVVSELVNQFKVQLTFRQLLEEYGNLNQLSDYLDSQIPADFFGTIAPAVTPAPVVEAIPQTPSAALSPEIQSTPSAAAIPQVAQAPVAYQPIINPSISSDLENVVSQQLQLMNRQLDLLSGMRSAQPMITQMSAPPKIAAPPPIMAQSVAANSTPIHEDTSTPAPKPFGAMARITTTKSEKKLSSTQENALKTLTATYCKKTALSKKMAQENRAVLADPRIVSGFRPEVKELTYQIHTVKSAGSKLWDVDGNEYVDMSCGFGTNFFGNVPEFIKDAIKQQLDNGMEIGPSLPVTGDVARLICEFTGAERAAFCSTGSEAVLAAMRLARTVTGKKIIVSFTNDYHGLFDEVVVRGNKKLRTTPGAPGIMASCVENILVLDYGSPESLAIIRERAGEIAGILVEPVQSRDPDLQPKEYLKEMRQLTEQLNICLVFDEVITGFRVAKGGCQEYFGIKADLGTYGKVIGGGLPMGVVAGKKKWMDALDGGHWQFGDDSAPTVGMTYFAGTYVRHPLALAAAKAVLEYLKSNPNIQKDLADKTTHLVKELNAWCQQVGAPIHIAHFSSMYRINYTQELPYGDLLYVYMRERGVHVWDHRPCFMTQAHSSQDIALIISAFKESVLAMQANGFMPGNSIVKPNDIMTNTAPISISTENAKLGRDPNGASAMYVADPNHPGKFIKIGANE